MEGKRLAIIDKDWMNLLDVIESTSTPGVFGIVALNPDGSTVSTGGGWGSWDVVGPASSTDNALARFDSTTGKLIQNWIATQDDNWVIRTTTFAPSAGTATVAPVILTAGTTTTTIVTGALEFDGVDYYLSF